MDISNDKTGMLEVGTHCAYCKQLDFLAFHCKYCDKDFCTKHRSQESHHCTELNNEPIDQGKVDIRDKGGAYFESLLPEKGSTRVQQGNEKVKQQLRDTDKDIKPVKEKIKNKSALDKILKFFQKKKSENYKQVSSRKNSSNKVIQLANLKKEAIGDNKIPIANRTYIDCYYVDKGNNDDPKKTSLYTNKTWSIGRLLDYIAIQLKVKNVNNNVNSDESEILYLYKKVEGDQLSFKRLQPSDRISNVIKDLDVLYLVRGEELSL
ncbi:hypothetical protein Kpol_1027p18 [Vanderwaltozyma polyspora DSM 70294]|uniref:AN1-type domain-containing protein n=1 Tax=Vanderwaltozyma polyspora (strain ATCC 22028 / DSM 70294 / BCRC 21397 / CBS 2163 / NBRC 10782 / NRRL Y-8283 / UCD 57-17) TaxID=436907 RepID=A7TQM3_VANPO|nr:uncharacterized protein Kpol_1027p18 [Vanderwaltozyma polyspora DSM 70294]EDO15444.1 hypothetical protein Kpol_1027p18 [Vanderwaltozyma polyspora DSM 70294]